MKLIGIMAVGTYYSPWTPYGIASIYNHVDEMIIVNGGFDLKKPAKREYTVPLEQVTKDIAHLDINEKITEISDFSIFDVKHKFPVAREHDKLWDKQKQTWYDQRGLNLTLAHETAVKHGADMILKIDSDQVCYSDVKNIRKYKKGKIFYQYEFVNSILYLYDPPPDSPFNDSVFSYRAREGFYGGGGAPNINAIREFCSGIHCAHLRYANPLHLSDEEKFTHFYGREWFFKMTNEGLWGKNLKSVATKSANHILFQIKGIPSNVRPPEATTYKDPLKYLYVGM